MIRQHDVQVLAEAEDSEVLADGTFRVVLTRGRRVVTAIDLPDSALGPLHLVFAVTPEALTPSTFATGSLFGDVGHVFDHVAHDLRHDAEKAAEGAFNAASKAATTLARPAFDITRDAAAAGASLIGHVPFVPEAERKRIEAASRTILRARLGDVNAQQFVRAVGAAAKAGVREAQHAGDALLTGTKIVARVLDTPMSLVGKIPKVGGALHALDPLVKMDHMADALQRGDFKGLKTMIENDAKMAQGVLSLIPGIGTGISAAISAGIGILDGGGPLEIAIETAYGAIPIPLGIREVTDTVLASVLELLHHPHDLTDAVLAGARNAIPSGMPRDVFDTLVKLIVHHMPITHVASDLVGTYVKRYAGDLPIPSGIAEAAAHVAGAAKVGGGAGSALAFAAKQLGGGKGEGLGGLVSGGIALAAGAHGAAPVPAAAAAVSRALDAVRPGSAPPLVATALRGASSGPLAALPPAAKPLGPAGASGGALGRAVELFAPSPLQLPPAPHALALGTSS
jgi:hypothetical protein